MNMQPNNAPAQPFFLQAAHGQRFCMYHPPNPAIACQGSLVYIHPFGDEMNKTRRMAALQARAFAACGVAVLQMDLFGCGDSSGEFRDAEWDIWKSDLALAKRWLEERVPLPAGLWGLRLGALLALDFARRSADAFGKIILWQPVTNGEKFLTQFLRLRAAAGMLSGSDEKAAGTRELRAALAAGAVLEIGGYEIAPVLAAGIDALDAADWNLTNLSLHWFDVTPEAGRTIGAASERVADGWRRQRADVRMHAVQGAPFWSTQEVCECTELLSATTRVFA